MKIILFLFIWETVGMISLAVMSKCTDFFNHEPTNAFEVCIIILFWPLLPFWYLQSQFQAWNNRRKAK